MSKLPDSRQAVAAVTESEAAGTALSPVKPVNLLPEIPVQTGRKLNDREQRDCEVMISSSSLTSFNKQSSLPTDLQCNAITHAGDRKTDQVLLLLGAQDDPGQCTQGDHALHGQLREGQPSKRAGVKSVQSGPD